MSAKQELPPVLACLIQEHKHFSALLSLLESKSEQSTPALAVDHYLMRDIIGYMHDYPSHIHHPTEALVFEKVLLHQPSLKPVVQGLQEDHDSVATETQHLLQLLDGWIDQPGVTRARAIRRASKAFVRHQREHMRFENEELFPAAIGLLSAADWRGVASHFAAVEDPLFGQNVGTGHRRLYEYMLGSSARAAKNLALSGLFSMERVMLAMDTLEQGRDAYWTRVKELLQDLAAETHTTVVKALKPDSVGAVIALPARFTFSLGKSMFDCSGDLWRISTTTAWQTLAHFGPRYRVEP